MQITHSMIKKIITRQFSADILEGSPETRLWIDVIALGVLERNRDPLFFSDGRCETICEMIGLEFAVIEMILNKQDELRHNRSMAFG